MGCCMCRDRVKLFKVRGPVECTLCKGVVWMNRGPIPVKKIVDWK